MRLPLSVVTTGRGRPSSAYTYWEDNDLIFCNEVGRHIQANSLRMRSFFPLLARAGVPSVRFHDLRHSCSTLLLLTGVHIKVVSELLGHSNIGLTLDTYSHVLPSMQTDTVRKMEAPFTVAI